MDFEPPSEDEIQAIKSIREHISSQTDSFADTTILRFYRGRKHDIERAARSLLRHEQWRREHDVNSIHEKTHTFSKELASGKVTIDGKDLQGRPCVYVHAHKHDKNERDIDEVRQLIIHTLETVIKIAKPEEERFVLCFDLSEFSYSCMDYDALKLLVETLQFNYPETLHVALVINAPFLFWACWGIIKQFLDPVSAAKAVFINKECISTYLDESSFQKK